MFSPTIVFAMCTYMVILCSWLMCIFIYCRDTENSTKKFTLISSSLSAPYDVTLKLSDGEIIKAHKMILAAVSPVFNGMFYGNFKEGKLDEVDLQEENSNVMKLFIDFIYNGDCQLDNLDDVLPLMKIVDYYQTNKVPFHLKCGKVILAELDSSNYLNLLPKFACVMSEESIQKAADKVMCYCKCDFIGKFDETKNLPEEVLLYLLQRNDILSPEVEIFDYLVKWHDYQTKELDKELKLVPQLFKHIRYSLVNPELLLGKVANCSHVNKQLLIEALDCLYNKPLDQQQNCKCGECSQQSTVNRLRICSNINWTVLHGGTITYNQNSYNIQYNVINYKLNTNYNNVEAAFSQPLKNGTYSFTVSGSQVLLSVRESNRSQLYNFPVTGYKVIVFVYDSNVFVKTIKDGKLRTSFSSTATPPFNLYIIGNSYSFNFQITHSV